MKAKHILLSVALLSSMLFLYQGCGGGDGQAPKGSHPFRLPGEGSENLVTPHSDMSLFLKFKEKVKNGDFNNTIVGDYSYRILSENSCKTVFKIFTACSNSFSTWKEKEMLISSVTEGGVTGHPWGTLPAINVKLNQLLGRVIDRVSGAGPGVFFPNHFVGYGDLTFDVIDNDGTVYRISRLIPLGANPLMVLKRNGGGRILTYGPPFTW